MKGYRKLAAFTLTLICATALNYRGKVGDLVYGQIVMAAIAAYMAGNVGSAAVKAKKEEKQ